MLASCHECVNPVLVWSVPFCYVSGVVLLAIELQFDFDTFSNSAPLIHLKFCVRYCIIVLSDLVEEQFKILVVHSIWKDLK